MGNSTSAKPRKATFTVTGKGKDRIFTAVNKRAHTVCKKAGKRTKVTVAELKKLKGTGSYKYFAYGEGGELKAIKV